MCLPQRKTPYRTAYSVNDFPLSKRIPILLKPGLQFCRLLLFKSMCFLMVDWVQNAEWIWYSGSLTLYYCRYSYILDSKGTVQYCVFLLLLELYNSRRYLVFQWRCDSGAWSYFFRRAKLCDLSGNPHRFSSYFFRSSSLQTYYPCDGGKER